MNLLHIKYAVEIAKTSSISKAAENLFVSQPNLSRAIKELEESLGITIFKRSPKGMLPTVQGEEFLGYARQILAQIDNVEKLYQKENVVSQNFSISVPRASYISSAFSAFVKKVDRSKNIKFLYKETNAMRAVSNIIDENYNLGILRYQVSYNSYFQEMLKEKGLRSEIICDFKYHLIMSPRHPLAHREKIAMSDLEPYIEIAHADSSVPSMPVGIAEKDDFSPGINKRIYVFERGSQMELLSDVEDSFMWVSPVPESTLRRYNLIQRECEENTRVYRDILICREDYKFSSLDDLFFDELIKSKHRNLDKACKLITAYR